MMTDRVARKDVELAFKRFALAARKLGVNTGQWRLATGSAVNGNSYGVFELEPVTFGHGTVWGFSQIGMTASEAYARLDSAANALNLVLDVKS